MNKIQENVHTKKIKVFLSHKFAYCILLEQKNLEALTQIVCFEYIKDRKTRE